MEYGLISIGGQKEFGKDVAGAYLVDRLNVDHRTCTLFNRKWRKIAYADSVKDIYCETFGVDRAFIEQWKRIKESPPGFDKPVRDALIFIGDGFRQIRSTIWIETLFKNMKANQDHNFIICDVRYGDESYAVSDPNYTGLPDDQQGCSILMWRKGYVNDDKSDSESSLRPYIDYCVERNLPSGPIDADFIPFNYFLRNEGTEQDLYREIDNHILPYIIDKWGCNTY